MWTQEAGSQSSRGTESPLCGHKGSYRAGDPAGDQLQAQGRDGMPSVGASGGEPMALLSPGPKDLRAQLLLQALLEPQQWESQDNYLGRWTPLESCQPGLWRAAQKKRGFPVWMRKMCKASLTITTIMRRMVGLST